MTTLMASTANSGGSSAVAPGGDPTNANRYDVERAKVLAEREADWRNGTIVYQVFVDRFAPSKTLEAKRHLYAPPRRLRDWSEKPTRGKHLKESGFWSHEVDFWGGDLKSLLGKLDYIQGLGVDVLYLNPIHQAATNHKYDAQDYLKIAPEYGTRNDVKQLASELHKRGMKLVLDGVFNHMGRTAPIFQEALNDTNSPYRDYFFFDEKYEHGYRAWYNVANLPVLRLENPKVRALIYGDADSVVRGFLDDGVDGWRLDVAPDLGFNFLGELTRAAHEAKPGSLVIGENWCYPDEWSPDLDAVMNFHFWQIIMKLVEGKLDAAYAGRMIDRAVRDTGLDPILKAWIVLDNHDLPRLKTQVKKAWQRRIAQVLQFTLPGSPCLYYGVELGMEGGSDPKQRGPMRWDLLADDNPDLQWTRKLIGLRKDNRALRIGDFVLCESLELLAFMRRTDRIGECTLVVVNPTDKPITEWLQIPEAKLLNDVRLQDQLSDHNVEVFCGMIEAKVPAHTVHVFRPQIGVGKQTGPYTRIQ